MKRISFSKFFPIILIALILPQLLFAQVAPKLNEITKTADVLETLGNDITLYRVNAGGNVNYVDHEGNTWNKDQQYSPGGWGYVGGNTHVKVRSINNTQDDELYQSERYGMSAYRFDVANGTYRAVLHFAEIYYRSTNKRVFDVIIEGIKVLDDYDIYADVGANTAVFKTYETTVSDGRLDIDFVTEIDASKISAIEIIAINQDQDPLLSVIPTTLDFGTTMYEMSFTIQNNGGGTLDWSAAENPDQAWLTSIAPNYGTLEAGASETVTIAVDRAELDDGDYNGIILVTSNGGEQDVTIAMHVRSSTGILYVKNLNGSSGAWQGKSPVFTSISAAASNAVDGDEIWVATGEYVENIQLKVGIKLYGGFEGDENSLGDRGDVWDDISRTTINAQNSGRCILAFSNNVIDGFKLINGNHDEGGGVYISNESNIEIRNLFIEACRSIWGAGIFIDAENTTGPILVERVIIRSCEADCGALEIRETAQVTLTVKNCTIVSNASYGLEVPYHEGVTPANANHYFYNNIIWGNQNPRQPDLYPDVWTWARDFTDYSYIGNDRWPGTEDLWGEPLPNNIFESEAGLPGFIDAEHGNFQLVSSSPCISAGKDGEDMGALPYVGNFEPILYVNPSALDFGSSITKLTFEVKNQGGGNLSWEASENPNEQWIKLISPNSGILSTGESSIVEITVDRDGLETGSYSGNITITSSAGNEDVALHLSVAELTSHAFRVNCGSNTSYTDEQNQTWEKDQPYAVDSWGFINGNTFSTTDPIANTIRDPLYQTERWGQTLNYQFDLVNGDYLVILHFAEIYATSAFSRIFDFSIENELVLDGYDIFAEVGHDAATSKSFQVTVSDGALNIDMTATQDAAKISAIEVLPVSDDPILLVESTMLDFGPGQSTMTFNVKNIGGGVLEWTAVENPEETWLTTINPVSGQFVANESGAVVVSVDRAGMAPGNYMGKITVQSNGGTQDVTVNISVQDPIAQIYRVNCGSNFNYVDGASNLWEADQPYSQGSWGYIRGNSYTTNHPIENTNDDILYQTERWGMDGYYFDVANGEYEVTLSFAEIYCTNVNKRVFHVEIEGERVLSNFDIFAEAGHDNALQKIFNVTVADDQLNIEFVSEIEDPKISAIQVIKKNLGGMVEQSITRIETGTLSRIPEQFMLYPNFPNPFNSSTEISFDLPFEARVILDVYNILGQKVNSLVEGRLSPGNHRFIWEGNDQFGIPLPTGIYIYRIYAIENSENEEKVFNMVRKMSLVK